MFRSSSCIFYHFSFTYLSLVDLHLMICILKSTSNFNASNFCTKAVRIALFLVLLVFLFHVCLLHIQSRVLFLCRLIIWDGRRIAMEQPMTTNIPRRVPGSTLFPRNRPNSQTKPEKLCQ